MKIMPLYEGKTKFIFTVYHVKELEYNKFRQIFWGKYPKISTNFPDKTILKAKKKIKNGFEFYEHKMYICKRR